MNTANIVKDVIDILDSLSTENQISAYNYICYLAQKEAQEYDYIAYLAKKQEEKEKREQEEWERHMEQRRQKIKELRKVAGMFRLLGAISGEGAKTRQKLALIQERIRIISTT